MLDSQGTNIKLNIEQIWTLILKYWNLTYNYSDKYKNQAVENQCQS